jgi:two-component system response regulator AtoC
MQVLLIDDETDLRRTLVEFLKDRGHTVREAASGAEGLGVLKDWAAQLAIVDIGLPDASGLELLPRIKQARPGCLVLMLTGFASTQSAVKAMQLGAENYLEKPVDLDELEAQVDKASEKLQLRGELDALRRLQLERYKKEYLFLPDEHMTRVYDQVERVADLEKVTVLVHGETGTGKEHVARMIHFLSKRAAGPWVELHCGALPETLLESELFGYEAGAFTDARKAKPGFFEQAQGGTLFLDEIGEMPLSTQVKLLKVLEDKRLHRLGGTREIQLDVRIVAATNRDLGAEVEAGRFRRDLWFRLNAFIIHLPPLRERQADIPALAQYFLDEACKAFERPGSILPKAVLKELQAHAWPGNVRELKNVVERMVITQQGPQPDWDTLSELLVEATPQPSRAPAALPPEHAGRKIKDVERETVFQALRETRGRRSQAAESLGMSRKTLFNKLKKWEDEGNSYPGDGKG